MQFYNRKQLLTIKAKIKGLAEEGRRTRKILQTKSGEVRSHYWDIKRRIGSETRLHLIAYGLLRGKRFSEIEPCTKVFKGKLGHGTTAQEYQLYWYWQDFPWKRLLDIIRLNVPSFRPDSGCVTINGRVIWTTHKYWSEENLKSLILQDKPLTDEELYDAKSLERIKAAS